MGSSLLLGRFDLMDVTSAVRLTDWDRSGAVPSVSEVQSTVLDGAVVVGRGASNRKPSFTLLVEANDRASLAALSNEVLALVDAPTWTLTWTPDGSSTVVYDCFRASVSITSTGQQELQGAQLLTVACEALPYGRSPQPQSVVLAGTSQQLDGFDSAAPTLTNIEGTSTVTRVTSPVFEGSDALKIVVSEVGPDGRAGIRLQQTISATTSADMQAISLRGICATNLAIECTSIVIVTAGTGGGSGTEYVWNAGGAPGVGRWAKMGGAVNGTIPSGAEVTSYTLDFDAPVGTFYLDDLRLFPAASTSVSDSFGGVTLFSGVLGSARTPVALDLTKDGGGTFTSWCVHTPPADRPDAQALIPLEAAESPAAYTTADTVRYDGTYGVWLVTDAVGSAGSARTWTVEFSQSLPSGGPTASLSGSFTPADGQALVYMGQVTLPVTQTPPEAPYTTTVTVTSTVAVDKFAGVLLLDTRGQTIIAGNDAPAADEAWIDAPAPDQAFGGVWSGATRDTAASIAAHLQAAATLLIEPGDSKVLLYSPGGALDGTVTYSPRWLQEATA